MDKRFKKDFIKGSLITSTGTASSMIFQFLSITIIIRQITKEEFGIFALIVVISNFLNTISGIGLEISIVKFISSVKDWERKSTFIPTIIIRIISIIVVSILVILFGNSLMTIFSFTAPDLLYVIITLFIVSNFRNLFYNLLQGLNLFKRYASVQIITSLLRVAILLVIVLISKLTLKSVLFVEMGVVTFAVLLQLAFIPYKEVFYWNVKIKNIIRILKFSIPLYFTSILSVIYNQVNIFLIGAYLTPVSVANYDIASKIPSAGKKGFQSFITVFYPNISKLFSKGERDTALTLMNKSLFTLSTAINMLLLVSFLFNKEIILLLFSDKYLDSSLAFSFLMVAFYLNSMSNIMGYSLVSAGFPIINLKISITSSGISLLGAFFMVPLWGFMGAVFSYLLATFFSLLLNHLYLIRYDMKIELINLVKPSLITLTAVIFYYQFIPDGLIYKVILIIAYLIVVYFKMPEARKIFNQVVKYLFKHKSENKVN